jgi:hypothetical protein
MILQTPKSKLKIKNYTNNKNYRYKEQIKNGKNKIND